MRFFNIFKRNEEIKAPIYDSKYIYPLDTKSSIQFDDCLILTGEENINKLRYDILFVNSFRKLVKKEYKEYIPLIYKHNLYFGKPTNKSNFIIANYHPNTPTGKPKKSVIDITAECGNEDSDSLNIYVYIDYLKDGSINRIDVEYYYTSIRCYLMIRKDKENSFYVYDYRETPTSYIRTPFR